MPNVKQLKHMRKFFDSGSTLPVKFRKTQLLRLRDSIKKYENELNHALYIDLKKSQEESWITEIGFVLAELNHTIKHLDQWCKPERVKTTLLNFPSRSFIYKEPLGVVFIIGPWNYPLNLLFTPLIGAIAAGNCVLLKAPEYAPATAAIMEQIVAETFDPAHVSATSAKGEDIIPHLMEEFIFDHVCFTGSTAVGRKIYEQAAKNLVPVTLELGGKSPCIVEENVDLKVAARRIVGTKFSNAGQMCVAPDYILVHQKNVDGLIMAMKSAIADFYGQDPANSADYGKIINEQQYHRLVKLLHEGTIVHGGEHHKEKLYIAPTLLTNISAEARIMSEEIFGPLLPVIPFTDREEAKKIIARHKNPLALYVFTSDRKMEAFWLRSVPAGGGCINNAALHLTNFHLPFGGRGFSGTGNYHGRFSFDTFSHKKGIMKTPTWFDPAAKYPPYQGKLKIFKWLTG